MSKQGEEGRKLLIKKAEEKIEQISTGYAYHVDAECITILRELMFELKVAAFESKSFQKLSGNRGR